MKRACKEDIPASDRKFVLSVLDDHVSLSVSSPLGLAVNLIVPSLEDPDKGFSHVQCFATSVAAVDSVEQSID